MINKTTSRIDIETFIGKEEKERAEREAAFELLKMKIKTE